MCERGVVDVVCFREDFSRVDTDEHKQTEEKRISIGLPYKK